MSSRPEYDREAPRPELSVNPLFTREPVRIPRDRLPRTELDPQVAYQVVHDELLLDGNPRLNLATFVTTWMEPEATRLPTETPPNNMIDQAHHPPPPPPHIPCP